MSFTVSWMKYRLVYILTHPASARYLMRGQLTEMNRHFNVAVVTAPGDDLDYVREREGVATFPVPMARDLSPIADAVALFRLYRLLRQLRPHLVNAGTTKAAFLGMVASFLARVPVRIYTLRGLRSETVSGWKRWALEIAERINSALAHRVICVSPSLRDLYLCRRLARTRKLRVLGSGSSNGVDCARFATASEMAGREALKLQLGLPSDALIFGFVGRLTLDKGMAELADAFERVSRAHANVRLMIVGGGFEKDEPEGIIEKFRRNPSVVVVPFVSDPSAYYCVMSVLVFPSHREGFPNVPLEAAAAAKAAVGFAATGVVDAIIHGVTGLLVPVGDTDALVKAMEEYIHRPELIAAHGASARQRVEREFDQRIVWNNLLAEYRELLRERGFAAQGDMVCAF